MSKLSPHFNSDEFECRGRDGCKSMMPPERMLTALETLRRDRGNRPLRIRSGYRCPARNSAVGGAIQSRHLQGDAVDIDAGYCTVAQAAAAGFTGIGSRGKWAVHLDCRPEPARWQY